MTTNDTPDWLRTHLDTLPAQVAPERDLWPEIALRLGGTRHSRPLVFAVAASLCLSVTAAFFTWHIFAQQRQEAATMLAARQVLDQIQQPYQPVRAEYESRWPALRAQLDPETAAVVEQNLAIIRKANQELEKALERQPGNPALRQMLQQTMAQELELYRRVDTTGHGAI